MIGIPTPNVCPSPNFNDTCTGFAGFGGLDDDGSDDADDELLVAPDAPAVFVTILVVVGPTWSEPQAVATRARTLSAATTSAAGRIRRTGGVEVTQTP
jgi:hypothetical protein